MKKKLNLRKIRGFLGVTQLSVLQIKKKTVTPLFNVVSHSASFFAFFNKWIEHPIESPDNRKNASLPHLNVRLCSLTQASLECLTMWLKMFCIPYLKGDGNAEEKVSFYKISVVAAQVYWTNVRYLMFFVLCNLVRKWWADKRRGWWRRRGESAKVYQDEFLIMQRNVFGVMSCWIWNI